MYLITGTARLVLLIFTYLICMQDAYAYLDPGTGSYVFQLAVAFLFGALFSVKMYWRKIRDVFAKLCSKVGKDDLRNDNTKK